MIAYTVLNRHSVAQTTGASLREAAETILTEDGHDFEIRRESNGVARLDATPYSRNASYGNAPMVRAAVTCSFAESNDAARDEIFADVLSECHKWGGMFAMTDADYAAEQAAIAAALAGDE